jgi:hypothetical protein
VALQADEAKVAQLVPVEGRFGRSGLLVEVIDLAQVGFNAPRDGTAVPLMDRRGGA